MAFFGIADGSGSFPLFPCLQGLDATVGIAEKQNEPKKKRKFRRSNSKLPFGPFPKFPKQQKIKWFKLSD